MSTRSQYMCCMLAIVFVTGCSEDSTSPGREMVTVQGVVRNIDTAELAQGVRVTLLGTGFADEVATGTDGAYSLKVPKGSLLYLHTDDFDTSNDAWIPVINIDIVPVVANENVPDFPIHSCPQTTCNASADTTFDGSVAIWDNYLQNADQNNGDMFVPTSTNGSGGVVVVLMGDCDNGTGDNDSIQVTSSVVDCPIGQLIADKVFAVGPLSCDVGPEIFYSPSRTHSDWGGFAVGFCDPAFSGQSVELTFADLQAAPHREIPSPFVVPIRPGTLSIVWAVTVNKSAATFKQWACGCLDPAVFCTP